MAQTRNCWQFVALQFCDVFFCAGLAGTLQKIASWTLCHLACTFKHRPTKVEVDQKTGYRRSTEFGSFPETPTPNTFSKYCRYKWEARSRTNRRCTAVQRGGVLHGFLFFRAWEPDSDTIGGRHLKRPKSSANMGKSIIGIWHLDPQEVRGASNFCLAPCNCKLAWLLYERV